MYNHQGHPIAESLPQCKTHIIGDFLHLVLLHEEYLGDLLTGALQDAGDQGVISGPQLLLFCNETSTSLHHQSQQQAWSSQCWALPAASPPLVWTMYSANSSAEFSI